MTPQKKFMEKNMDWIIFAWIIWIQNALMEGSYKYAEYAFQIANKEWSSSLRG
jgi:hypothetical protein